MGCPGATVCGATCGLQATQPVTSFSTRPTRRHAFVSTAKQTWIQGSADLAVVCEALRIRLFEKNGTVVDVACHHNLEEYLFCLHGRDWYPGREGMHRNDVVRMIWRRAKNAGLDGVGIGCHTFRATAYLKGGG